LKLLSSLTELPQPPQKILDLGAGSGVLALAAALIIPEAAVSGTDNDPDTVPVAEGNRENNEEASRVAFSYAEDLLSLKAREDYPGPFDLILANITLNPLMALASQISESLASRGRLILSGLLENQTEEIIGAYRGYGFKPLRRLGQGEWSALLLERESPSPLSLEEAPSPEREIVPEPSLETLPKTREPS
jgi:ribosomal protein L11 methyltransferase